MSTISTGSIKSPKVNSGVLYSSEFCELKSWEYDFKNDRECGYNDCLCIVYVRKGNFQFDLSKNSYNMHSGSIIIDKPYYEYHLRPSSGESTIFNFTEDCYKQFVDDCNLKHSFFFSNPNVLSLMVKATPEIDYVYFNILRKIPWTGKLEMDGLVLELIKAIVALITNENLNYTIANSTRRLHLRPIEKAKEYINGRFATDISLYELADHCCVSPFHFTRIFKKFTSYTPHQYLHNIRLKHGETLLRKTNIPIYDIAFSSGFNSVEYFATAFKQRFQTTPSQYRAKMS